MDFSNYKFRCSGLKNLMVNSRKKGEILSETSKTYLRDIFINETYGRIKPELKGPACTKGTMVESDTLDLIQQVAGLTYFKNSNHLENDFIKGTPDVILSDRVIDIKSSWDIWTFAAVNDEVAKHDYFYQILGYMWLTGKEVGELNYGLVNTPDMIINDQQYKLSFKFDEEEVKQFAKNYIFDDIDPKLRFKRFIFGYDLEAVEELKIRIVAAREYLNNLSL